jgi:dynein heavy chain
MVSSTKDFHERSLQDYNKKEREKWVLLWQGMAVIAVSMMYWTSQAEDAMKKGGLAGLKAYGDKLNKQLLGLVNLVRNPISKLNRCTIEALVVIDVHAKDVIHQQMIDKQIAAPNDFAWLRQMRYYWDDNNVMVQITNSVMDYNYEYLGNSSRLVITPLTDRCYITLCGAIYLNYGGAPEGPAGTGKTETVKDLSKALARQCLVFNCSDGLDYKQMGKFFKGLASCGAWSCFDEFNRIELEVLSVVAQQLQWIQLAVEAKLERFMFDKDEIPLKLTTNCFITMNPGYAGRSELPDNLKALFRTVSMMVPDYGMIAEISLYSYGFSTGKALASKIVNTFKLCSEQLSSQKHYDYGMRAVKSVLTAAGNLYLSERTKAVKSGKEVDEAIVMLRAITDVNLAKFLTADVPLFKNITSDLFPGTVLPEPDYVNFLNAYNDCLKRANKVNTPYLQSKFIETHEMIKVRHGVMIVGLAMSSKFTILKTLAETLTQLAENKLEDASKVLMQIINPKSVTVGQFFGKADEVSHDWFDGVCAVYFRDMSKMDPNLAKWLVFDGPVDTLWIESMNTVLDDSKMLCLMSGEIIRMGPNMNCITIPADLQEASPATVSRNGVIYMQPHLVGWRPMYESWKNTLPKCFYNEGNEAHLKNIDELVDVVVQPCIDYIRNDCHEITPTDDQSLVQALLRLWSSLLKIFDEQDIMSGEKKKAIAIVDSCFLFAAIWSLCVTIGTDYRRKFDMHMKKVCEGGYEGVLKFNNKKLLPSLFDKGLVYDYVYFPEKDEWAPWMSLTDKDQIDNFPKESIVQDIVVTTIDTIRYSFIQEHAIHHEIPTLFCGPTGTGKTCYIEDVLLNKLDKTKYMNIKIGLSAQTHVNQVQEIIDGKLEKRRQGVFGARLGQKIVIFVDDLNMPKLEQFGAQPPIELLRQFLKQGGWYELKDPKHPFRTFVDTMLICAMGPPGGGKSYITPRMQRHMNVVGFAECEDKTMKGIFGAILRWFFRTGDFVQECAALEGKIVDATLQIYK